jgi:cell division transport system permease protein
MIKNFVYFIKEALRGFYQAKMMTFVSVMTIGFALFFMGVFAVAYLNIRSWFSATSNRVEVVAFIKDSALSDSAGVREILSRIRACSQVANATFVDKKAAWERFKGAYGTAMLSAVDDNPFPASVEISLVQSAQSTAATEELQNLIQEIPGIEDIQISRQWVKLLQRFKTYFFIATFAIGLILIFALHFMIANTIKLTIYARRELVHNMHFVGATDFYIKMPFILEGLVQGVIGACIAAAALYSVKLFFMPHVHVYWGRWYLFLLLFPVGALFGCIGSISAVRKFLV